MRNVKRPDATGGELGRPLLGTVAALMLGLSLLFGSLTLGAFGILQSSVQLGVGDVWSVGPTSITPALPGISVRASVVSAAGLASGAECRVGLGAEAERGGTLVIFGREANGDYLAGWAGLGRSAKTGTDCGRSAELRLRGHDVDQAMMAVLLAPMVGAMGSL